MCGRCLSWVNRYTGDPAASPAMSAMPPKAEVPNEPRGVRQVDDRRVLDSIFASCVQVRHGATFKRPMVPARLVTIDSFGG
jgi:hypothetical protein